MEGRLDGAQRQFGGITSILPFPVSIVCDWVMRRLHADGFVVWERESQTPAVAVWESSLD